MDAFNKLKLDVLIQLKLKVDKENEVFSFYPLKTELDMETDLHKAIVSLIFRLCLR